MPEIPTSHSGLIGREDPYIMGSSRFWDSPQLALSNMLGGDFWGATEAITRPEELSPEQRKKISTRLGLKNTWAASLVDITTHPLALMGLVLSLRYRLPTAAALQRYTKAAADAGSKIIKPRLWGLERLAPFPDNYAGTPIPDLFFGVAARHAEKDTIFHHGMIQAAKKYYDRTGVVISEEVGRRIVTHLDGTALVHGKGANRTWYAVKRAIGEVKKGKWTSPLGYSQAEGLRLHAKLERPFPLPQLNPAELEVAQSLKGLNDTAWDVLFKDPRHHKEVLEALYPYMGHSPVKLTGNVLIKKVDNFLPRVVQRTPEQYEQLIQARIAGESSIKDLLSPSLKKVSPRAAERVSTKSAINRTWGTAPTTSDLRALGMDEELLGVMDRYTREMMGGRAYSLNINVLPRYYDGVARTYAWTLPTAEGVAPLGKDIAKGVRKLYTQGTQYAKVRAQQLQNVYIPMALGRLTPKQLEKASQWGTLKERVVESMESGVLSKVMPRDLRARLSTNIINDPTFTRPAVGEAMSGYFYLSTLGGNAVSTGRNALQTLATLVPTVGLKNASAGYNEVARKLPQALKVWGQGKKGMDEVVDQVWPEFAQAHLELDPLTRRALHESLEETFTHTLRFPKGARRGLHKVGHTLMAPFSTSEMGNRLVSFYASLRKARQDLPGHHFYDWTVRKHVPVPKSGAFLEKASIEWARQNTMRTQFGGGWMNRPELVSEWWAPYRQFTTFGGRLAHLVTQAATEPAMRPVLYRMMAGAGLAYGVGQEAFGHDFSQGLVFGGIPVPEEGRMFAPMPMVPPFVQVLGAAGMALTGDTEELRRSAGLAVPGGIAFQRAAGLQLGGVGVPMRGVSRFMGKPYADYQNRLPDGRIGVYSPNGSLQGYYTPTQIYMRAWGIAGSTSQQEMQATKVLMGNRKRVRTMKRDLMQALHENDAWGAVSILQDYERVYPRTGGTMLRKSDIRALHMRRDVARLERLLETLPGALKPEFIAALSASLGPHFQEFLGLTQGLAAGQTIMEREPYRLRSQREVAQRVGQTLHGKKLSDRMESSGYREAPAGRSPFETFGGF